MDRDLALDGVRVVVWDDERPAAIDLATLLSEQGAETTVWTAGGEELAAHLGERFDVAVVGAELDGEGLSRADQLREAARRASAAPRVVVATGGIARETLERHAATVTAADAYLRKPYDEERARACFARLKDGAPGPDERLWWLDDQADEPPPPEGATGSGSGSPVGVPPGFRF